MSAQEKLSDVYLNSRPALQRFLALKTNCPDTAADLVQELYFRLPSLKPVPPTETAIRAWLFRVAANLAVDNFRKLQCHAALLSESGNIDEIHPQSTPSPEATLLQQDQLQRLQEQLQTLPTVCAQVLYLNRIDGLSHQAIAEQLGISKSWVEKQLARALNHLRTCLDD